MARSISLPCQRTDNLVPTGPKGEKRSAAVRAPARVALTLAPNFLNPTYASIQCIDPTYVRVSESANWRKFGLPRLRTEATVCRRTP